MNVNGEFRLPAPREAVWRALHDPATLFACIPGCEEVRQAGDGAYEGRFAVQVGAVATVYTGRATVSEAEYPLRYTVSAHVHSPTGGQADGVATVTLSQERDGTLVGYRGRLDPGGRLASVGERLLHGVAIRMANEFFTRLIERLAADISTTAPFDRAEPRPHPHFVVVQPIAPTAPTLRPPPPPAAEPVPPPSPAGKLYLMVGLMLWLLIVALLAWPRG